MRPCQLNSKNSRNRKKTLSLIVPLYRCTFDSVLSVLGCRGFAAQSSFCWCNKNLFLCRVRDVGFSYSCRVGVSGRWVGLSCRPDPTWHDSGGGAVASESGRGLCECGKEFSKSYIARHRKSCRAVVTRLETEVVEWQPRVYKRGVKVTCDCGAEVTKSNFSRHKREACPNGEAGP